MNVEGSNPVGTTSTDTTAGRSSKAMIIVFIAVIVIFVAYMALGMPGMDHGPTQGQTTDMDMDMDMDMDDVEMSAMPPSGRLVDPASFARAVDDPSVIVINVHVPFDGAIKGTDLTIAYDALDPALLPAAPGAALAVYCRSGTMSAEAVEALSELGYSNVVELDGGMIAWVASGRPIDRTIDDD